MSVCIANWNCRDMLWDCLASLHDHPQGVEVETIVVDNASTDGAPEMVEREFPEAVLIRNQANVGFSRANNQAADRSRGRYLFFLNNDTVVPPFALQQMVEYLEEHPEVGMVGPLLRGIHGEVQVSYRTLPDLAGLFHRTMLLRWTGLFRNSYLAYRRDHFDASQVRQVEVLMGAALLMPRRVYMQEGRWDENFTFGGEDLELSARIGRSHPIVFNPTVEIIHYGRVSTRQNIAFSLPNVAIGMIKYMRKQGYSRIALLLYKLAVSLDAPLTAAVKGLQYLYRRWKGRDAEAKKSYLAMRASWHVLRSWFVPLWKA